MFWSLVLPFKITFWAMAAIVVLLTAFAPVLKWKRGTVFLTSWLMALVLFVPSCSCVTAVLDASRFGVFQHATFTDVNDVRVESYLPRAASAITVQKSAMGHRAKYSITQKELMKHLDQLWENAKGRSAVSREELGDGETVNADSLELYFRELEWPLFEPAVRFRSPVQSDGGGATYFFDPLTETAYHRAGYW